MLARDKFASHGIGVNSPQLNLAVMMRRKDDLVGKLTDGIAYLFKKNGIQHIRGAARLAGRDPSGFWGVEIDAGAGTIPAGEQQDPSQRPAPIRLTAQRVLLATGSEATTLPGVPFDGQVVVSAREALGFDSVPEHLVVAGEDS